VEVLLVIIILGIITVIALPRFVGHTDRARTSVVLAELQSMKTVVELHFAEAGRLPAASVSDQPGTVRRVMNDGGLNWGGPAGLGNAWGNPYHYATSGTRYIVYTQDNSGAPGVFFFVTDAHPPGTGPKPASYDLAGPVPSRS
jgi:type II secretory pathway pseudopilin PulG